MVNLAESRQPQRGKRFPRKAQEENLHADQFLESDSYNLPVKKQHNYK